MTFNLASYRVGEEKTFAQIEEIANLVFDDAKALVAGTSSTPMEYAKAWKEKFAPHQDWREGRLKQLALDALACAKNIVARDKTWWVHTLASGAQTLIVVSLTADASAGPVGYMPLTEVKTDESGKVVEYAIGRDVNGTLWAPVDPDLFGSLLRACGLSLSDAADFLMVSESTVKHFASGRRAAKPGMYKELSDLHRAIIEASEAPTRQEVSERAAGLPPAAARTALAIFQARHPE